MWHLIADSDSAAFECGMRVVWFFWTHGPSSSSKMAVDNEDGDSIIHLNGDEFISISSFLFLALNKCISF